MRAAGGVTRAVSPGLKRQGPRGSGPHTPGPPLATTTVSMPWNEKIY